MALTISQLVNDYGSYSGTTLIGERGARANVPSRGFGDVRGVPYDNITFVIKVNGTKYASSKWLAQQQNGNPYLSSNTVARIDNYNIPNPPLNFTDPDGEGEKYAEIKATSNLNSDTALLSFINDLLDSNDEIKQASSYGSWSPALRTVTIPQEIKSPIGTSFDIGVVGKKFGNTYSAELDYLGGNYPGLQFEPGKVIPTGSAALDVDVSLEPQEVKENVTDTGSGITFDPIEIDLSDFTFDPIDFQLDPIDFGIGDINTNFGFGLGGDVSVGGTNQFTGVTIKNDDFITAASTAYSGFVTDANDVNEPEIFASFGNFGP